MDLSLPTLYLILAGANHYGDGLPGATLHGCINDLWSVYNWVKASVKPKMNVVVTSMGDEQDTYMAFRNAFADAIDKARAIDKVWLHDSSHGTAIPINGQNHGAIVHYDSDFNNLDSFTSSVQLKDIAAKIKPGTQVLMTSDSCASGDLTRAATLLGSVKLTAKSIQAPPAMQIMLDHNRTLGTKEIASGIPNICYISGSGPDPDTSADVMDQTGAYGAFTHLLLPEILTGKIASVITKNENAALRQQQFTQTPIHSGPDYTWPGV